MVPTGNVSSGMKIAVAKNSTSSHKTSLGDVTVVPLLELYYAVSLSSGFLMFSPEYDMTTQRTPCDSVSQ